MDADIKQRILKWLSDNYIISIVQPDDYELSKKDAPFDSPTLNYQTDLVDAIQDEFPQDDYGSGLADEEVAEVAEEWALSHIEEQE
jgi:hypothetical protein